MHIRVFVFPLLACFFIGCTDERDRPPSPNIMFYVDDLGWMDVAYNGNEYYETPNIDRLARESMKFNYAYANTPFCSPSRASLMTGLYTPAHQVYIPDQGSTWKEGSAKAISS